MYLLLLFLINEDGICWVLTPISHAQHKTLRGASEGFNTYSILIEIQISETEPRWKLSKFGFSCFVIQIKSNIGCDKAA